MFILVVYGPTSICIGMLDFSALVRVDEPWWSSHEAVSHDYDIFAVFE